MVARILLVEDNPDMLEMIADTLSMDDHEVLRAKHGQEALDILDRSLPLPSLVITDLMMPVLDGIGLIARLRADPHLRRLPCLVISGDPNDQDRALDGGADAFLVKPFRFRDLMAVMDQLVD